MRTGLHRMPSAPPYTHFAASSASSTVANSRPQRAHENSALIEAALSTRPTRTYVPRPCSFRRKEDRPPEERTVSHRTRMGLSARRLQTPPLRRFTYAAARAATVSAGSGMAYQFGIVSTLPDDLAVVW